jgi:hypothetical protein
VRFEVRITNANSRPCRGLDWSWARAVVQRRHDRPTIQFQSTRFELWRFFIWKDSLYFKLQNIFEKINPPNYVSPRIITILVDKHSRPPLRLQRSFHNYLASLRRRSTRTVIVHLRGVGSLHSVNNRSFRSSRITYQGRSKAHGVPIPSPPPASPREPSAY